MRTGPSEDRKPCFRSTERGGSRHELRFGFGTEGNQSAYLIGREFIVPGYIRNRTAQLEFLYDLLRGNPGALYERDAVLLAGNAFGQFAAIEIHDQPPHFHLTALDRFPKIGRYQPHHPQPEATMANAPDRRTYAKGKENKLIELHAD